MTNPSDFQRSTEPRLETPPPFPSAEGATTLVERAEDRNDETPESRLQSARDFYDKIRKLFNEMDGLFHVAFVNIATVTEIAGRCRARNDDLGQ